MIKYYTVLQISLAPPYLSEITRMITSRINAFRRLTYTRLPSKPRNLLNECSHCYRDLRYSLIVEVGKVSSSVMEQRRRKGDSFEWRSVSTQATSSAVEAVKAQACTAEGSIAPSVGENDVECRLPGDSVTGNNCISMEVGASLMRFVKGKGGETQKKIEDELEVKLLFPSSRNEDSIMIEGNSAENVAAASQKVQTIIDEAVESPNLDYSHFISLPLAIHPELVDKLFNFQNSLLGTTKLGQDDSLESNSDEAKNPFMREAPGITVELKAEDTSDHVTVDISNIPHITNHNKGRSSSGNNGKALKLSVASEISLDIVHEAELGIEKSIFIKPRTFHLTVLMLKLWNKKRIKAATDVLQSISSQVLDALDGRPVFVRLNGLQSMRGSLSKARVLYAPVEEVGGGDRLVRACQLITNAFVDAGLVLQKDERQKLLLHATIMNARHRKRKIRTRKVDSFDARGVMEQYGSEEWGEYLIREAHLSQRFIFDESGYYHCCASIPFPQGMISSIQGESKSSG